MRTESSQECVRPFSAASLSRWLAGAPPWGSSLFQNGHAVPHGPSSSNRHLLPSCLDGRKQFLIFLRALSCSSLETPRRGLPSESGNVRNCGFLLGVDHLLSGLCCCGCTFFFRDAQTCTMDPLCCANLSPATSGSGFLVCSIWDTLGLSSSLPRWDPGGTSSRAICKPMTLSGMVSSSSVLPGILAALSHLSHPAEPRLISCNSALKPCCIVPIFFFLRL